MCTHAHTHAHARARTHTHTHTHTQCAVTREILTHEFSELAAKFDLTGEDGSACSVEADHDHEGEHGHEEDGHEEDGHEEDGHKEDGDHGHEDDEHTDGNVNIHGSIPHL